MSQLREDVMLEIATMLLNEQHEKVLYHFHHHLLFLEDSFFTLEQQKQETFDLAATFLLPVNLLHPLSLEQMEGIESRFQRLLRAFEVSCEEELIVFREEGEALKQRMSHLINLSEEKYKTAERRRQDDFMEMSISCQKEVAAITAELRTGVLNHFQDSRMNIVLEEALSLKVNELREIQLQLETVTDLRLREFTEHQKVLQHEREKYRQRFFTLQQETAKTMEEMTDESEERHRQHLRELQEMQRHFTTQIESLEEEIKNEREASVMERTNYKEEMDYFRDVVKKLEEEKTQLTQEIIRLQTQIEEWRRRYNERDSRAKMELIEHQTLAEAMKVEEAQTFRKQLVGAVRRGASSSTYINYTTPTSFGDTSMTHNINMSTSNSRKNGDNITGNSLSPVVKSNYGVNSPITGSRLFTLTGIESIQSRNSTSRDELMHDSYNNNINNNNNEKRIVHETSRLPEDTTNPYSKLVLHTPSSSYVKLMNLSEQLKKHIESN